jgi:hypothetical protein
MSHLFSIGPQRLGKSAAKGQCIIVEMPQTRLLTRPQPAIALVQKFSVARNLPP